MAKRIEEAILNFYDLLILAVKIEKDRKETLKKASFELERLKHYLRLCNDLGIFSIKQFEYSSKSIVEIGNILGGWIKKPKGYGHFSASRRLLEQQPEERTRLEPEQERTFKPEQQYRVSVGSFFKD